MFKSVMWFVAGCCLILIVGPVTLFASQSGRADPQDVYIIVDGGASHAQTKLSSFGARGIAPLQATLAQMIHAPPASREKLLQAGYLLLPASTLAAICGIATDGAPLIRKS